MYVNTVNPKKYSSAYIVGGVGTSPCGVKVPRYGPYNFVVNEGEVTSWRGVRNLQKCRAFERYQYEISGFADLWFCNLYNYMDGGSNWMHFAPNHSLTKPKLAFTPDALKHQAEDLRFRDNMIAELYAKANEAQFDGATFLAELGETIFYVTKLVKSFVSLTLLFKESVARGKDPAGTWLEWRYAIQPLMLTIQDVCQLLTEKHRPKEKVQVYSVHTERSGITEHVFSYSYGVLAFKAQTTTTRKCGSALWVESQWDEHPFGDSLYDMIRAGWEVVPASFVFDWFIGVGVWLDSFRNTNLKVGERYATLVTQKQVKMWVDEGSSIIGPGGFIESPTYYNPYVANAYHITRVIGDDVAPPMLPCLVSGPLSWIHKLDALALIVGLIKGLRR